jgi:hypothetical protein
MKNRKFFITFSLLADIQCMASFRFTEAFELRLQELAEKLDKSKTSVVVEAVNAYVSSILPDRGLLERLDRLSRDNAEFRREIDELKTLITQVLRNQQHQP